MGKRERHRKHREFYYTGPVFDRMLEAATSGVPKPMFGYEYGKCNIPQTCKEIFGEQSKNFLVHSSGLFFVKDNNGVYLNKYPYGVRRITVLEREADGYHYPLRTESWKIAYFHDRKPWLLEVEVDRFLYTDDNDDGFYLFRYDDYQRRFIMVDYDEQNKKLIDKE